MAALIFLSYTPTATAQTVSRVSDTSADLDFYGEVEVEHSDNIFRQTDSQQARMAADDPEDSESGRFKDMDSASDTIISPIFGMNYKTRGLWGEDLGLSARMKYDFHTENPEKSHPEAKIRLKNDIGKKGRLALEGNFQFDNFKKNYLAGYNDENDNGNIPRDERIYSSAIYDEYEGILSYEHEFYKNNDTPLSQVDLKPFVGYSSRSYNAPFGNRDRDTVFGGLSLTLEFLSRLDLELAYRYENVSAPGDGELVLFDETRFDLDVNGDGEIEGNAPLVTEIDRSADRHTFEITPSFKVSKDIMLFAGYEKRISDDTSNNPLDLDHYKNTSYRTRFKTGIEYDFSKSWSTGVEYRHTDDEDEEDGDYSENRFTFSIRYEFP
jgi:hypothetical protein